MGVTSKSKVLDFKDNTQMAPATSTRLQCPAQRPSLNDLKQETQKVSSKKTTAKQSYGKTPNI